LGDELLRNRKDLQENDQVLMGDLAGLASAFDSPARNSKHMGIGQVSSDDQIPSSQRHSAPLVLDFTEILEEALPRSSYSQIVSTD
jgi:hypothetical protein